MRCRYGRVGLLVSLILVMAAPSYGAAKKKSGAARDDSSSTAPQRLGSADAWTAYSYKEKSARVCYLVGEPQKTDPPGAKRKPPTAMVTHRPDEKIANVVSIVEGYPLKEGSDAALEVGGAKFDLFTKGDSAWARTAELDKAIVEAMTKAKQAVVKGIPQKGQPTTDTYSLSGFPQTLALIDKACSVKR